MGAEIESSSIATPENLIHTAHGFIFDLCGTVLNDEEKIWAPAIRQTLVHFYGTHFKWPERAQFQGVKLSKYLTDPKPLGLGLDADPDQIYELIKDERDLKIKEIGLHPMPGAVELITALKRKNYKLAIASSTSIDLVREALKEFGLENAFGVIIAKENTKGESKPAPDIFLQAAEELGLPSSECVVFEDAESGVLGAIAAKSSVIAIPNPFRSTGAFAQANFRIHSLSDLNLQLI